ncbi:hypothetical protein B0H10DRAFT_1956495 [Mycena sp. CBHHK59/15]|nr:hypothetical protein B0H10DRAFT_1956495 [Mycena sp. CBHHK59/15]
MQQPQLPSGYQREIDPQANLPARLQLRLDEWRHNPPTSQFSVYGPMAAYYHHKFPTSRFLVKPQAFLSPEAPPNAPGHHRIDSHGAAVTETKRYPDFTICQYWGADSDENPRGDVIRVISEIGTNERDKDTVIRKLEMYLIIAGAIRFDTHLLGIGQVKNEVFLIENVPNTARVRFRKVFQDWISIFSDDFVHHVNTIRDFSITRD